MITSQGSCRNKEKNSDGKMLSIKEMTYLEVNQIKIWRSE